MAAAGAAVEVVYDKKKTSSDPERVEKKTKIYGMSRRDPTDPVR